MLNMPLMKDNIVDEDIECLIRFLRENHIFTQSKKVKELEEAWSRWLGVKYSVFVNSGSSANFITMWILKSLYGAGEVVTSPIGWSSDVASILNAGHKPVFADVNIHNLSMNDEEIITKLNEKTKAVLLTHVLGFNALTDHLLEELEKRNILLIEDCCESHGASHHGRKIGTFGKISNFSFYYAHHMSTIEGGMICTDDPTVYEYARMFRSHGMIRECNEQTFQEELQQQCPDTHPEFTFWVPGFNMRSTELNAVIGLNQLKRLDENNRKRDENFNYFLENLDANQYVTEFDLKGSVNYAFILLLRKKDDDLFAKVTRVLGENQVEFRRGTAGGGNLARQHYIREACPHLDPQELINAEYIHNYGLYFGNYVQLTKAQILDLCMILNKL